MLTPRNIFQSSAGILRYHGGVVCGGFSLLCSSHQIRLSSTGCLFGKVLSLQDLKEYLSQVASQTSGSSATKLPIPNAVQKILSSQVCISFKDSTNAQACRGAIMFGDRLEVWECKKLLDQLAETRHPFVCAHGRPSLVPIFVIQPRMGCKTPCLNWQRLKRKMSERKNTN